MERVRDPSADAWDNPTPATARRAITIGLPMAPPFLWSLASESKQADSSQKIAGTNLRSGFRTKILGTNFQRLATVGRRLRVFWLFGVTVEGVAIPTSVGSKTIGERKALTYQQERKL